MSLMHDLLVYQKPEYHGIIIIIIILAASSMMSLVFWSLGEDS